MQYVVGCVHSHTAVRTTIIVVFVILSTVESSIWMWSGYKRWQLYQAGKQSEKNEMDEQVTEAE